MPSDLAEGGRQAAALTASVRDLMEEAGRSALLSRYRQLEPHEVEEKEPGETVTAADRHSEAILTTGLAALLPDAMILAEEAAHADPRLMDGLGAKLCWIIDPLDGTGHYASGAGPFGIIVALAAEGLAVGGWILDPLSGRFCWAASGHGAFIAGNRVQVADRRGERPTIGLSALLRRLPNFDAIVACLQSSHEPVDIPRCAAEVYPSVAFGAPDLALFERTLPWDHAAGVLFLSEAGGHCARIGGKPYRVDDRSTGLLTARSRESWELAAGLLRELPSGWA